MLNRMLIDEGSEIKEVGVDWNLESTDFILFLR